VLEVPPGPVVVEVDEPTLPGPRIVVSVDVPGTPTGAWVVVLVVVEPVAGGTLVEVLPAPAGAEGLTVVVDEEPAPSGVDGLIVVVDEEPAPSDGFCVVVVVVDCWARAGTARIRPAAAVTASRAFRIKSSICIDPLPDQRTRSVAVPLSSPRPSIP
jgi:hypothetical protein